ncbi:MAG TPA: hypothetical protein VFH61_12870, partial [Thermoleophilia bacterium]|nr:hypothetical protein [Thermoleophilia bacterium]
SIAGSFSDAASEAKHLTQQAKDVLAADEEITKNLERAKRKGIVASGRTVDQGSGSVPVFEVDRSAIGLLDTFKGTKKLVDTINANLKILADRRRRALETTSIVRRQDEKKAAEAAAKLGEDQKRIDEERAKRDKERADALKAAADAARKAGQDEAKIKEMRKAREAFGGMERGAARDVDRAEAVSTFNEAAGGIVDASFAVSDALEKLAAAAKTGRISQERTDAAVNDTVKAYEDEVAGLVLAQIGTEKFSGALSTAMLRVADAGGSVDGLKERLITGISDELNGIGKGLDVKSAAAGASFPELHSAVVEFEDAADPIRQMSDALETLGFSTAEAETRLAQLRDATEASIAAIVNETKDSAVRAKILAQVKDQAKRLGLAFDDVTKKVKKITFEETTAKVPPGLAESISKGMFGVAEKASTALVEAAKKPGLVHNSTRGLSFSPENAKGLTDSLGGSLASVISGSSSIPDVIGSALGTVIGNPAIGQAIVGAVEAMFNAIQGAVVAVADTIASLIPEKRLSGAVSKTGAIIAPIIAAFAVVAIVAGVVAGALWPIFLPLTILLAALGFVGAAVLADGVAILFLIGAIVWAIGMVVGFIVGAVLGPLLLFAAGLVLFLGLFAVIGMLATKTEAFAEGMELIGVAVDEVMGAFSDKLAPTVDMFVGLFSFAVQLLVPLMDAFATGMAAMAPILFDVIKGVLVAFGNLILMAALTGNGLIDVVQFFAPVLVFLANAVGLLIHSFNQGAVAMLSLVKWVQELFGMTAEAALTQAMITTVDLLGGAVVGVVDSIQGAADKLDAFKIPQAGLDAIRDTIDVIAHST